MTDRVRFAALTCIGLRREHNEDAVVVGDMVLTGDLSTPVDGVFTPEEPMVLAVADGLGGHAAGERASRLVADGLAARASSLNSHDAIVQAVTALNDDIYQVMLTDESTRGMGTTVAGVVVGADSIIVFHSGDSRVYVRRGDVFEQVTQDDVVAQQPWVLTNCLGGENRPTSVDVHTADLDPAEVATVLICSDGLSDLIDLHQVVIPLGTRPASAVSTLRDLAFAGGAHDNVSIIYADIGR